MTYFTARSNLITEVFLWEKVKTVDFSETIAASDLKFGRHRQLIEFLKACVGADWRSGLYRASDYGPRGPWFEPQLGHRSLWP